MKDEKARSRLQEFIKKYDDAHLQLAYYAAVPLQLTPNLLNLIRLQFPISICESTLEIPWVAISNLLLSELCLEVSGGIYYKMRPDVRKLLLFEMEQSESLKKRIQEISKFLLHYLKELNKDLDSHYYQIQLWCALSYHNPNQVVREIVHYIGENKQDETCLNFSDIFDILTELEENLIKSNNFIKLLAYCDIQRQVSKKHYDKALHYITNLKQSNYIDRNNKIKICERMLLLPELSNDLESSSKAHNYRYSKILSRQLQNVQDIRNSDFSYADIRGLDLSEKNLSNTNFKNAICGLSPLSEIVFSLFVLLTIFFTGLITAFLCSNLGDFLAHDKYWGAGFFGIIIFPFFFYFLIFRNDFKRTKLSVINLSTINIAFVNNAIALLLFLITLEAVTNVNVIFSLITFLITTAILLIWLRRLSYTLILFGLTGAFAIFLFSLQSFILVPILIFLASVYFWIYITFKKDKSVPLQTITLTICAFTLSLWFVSVAAKDDFLLWVVAVIISILALVSEVTFIGWLLTVSYLVKGNRLICTSGFCLGVATWSLVIGNLWLSNINISGSIKQSLSTFGDFNHEVVDELISAFIGVMHPSEMGVLYTLLITCILYALSFYVSNQALEEKTEYSWIKHLALSLTTKQGTNFSKTTLVNADFSGALLSNSNFSQANIKGTIWLKGRCMNNILSVGNYLSDSEIRQWLSNGKLQVQEILNLDISGINLCGFDLSKIKFIKCKLSNADFRFTTLKDTQLIECDVKFADFRFTTLKDIQLIKCKNLDERMT